MGMYFITFRTYGTWLPGDSRGTVNRHRRGRGQEPAPRNDALYRHAEKLLKSRPVVLAPAGRMVVEASIRRYCRYRDWDVLAVNVRTNHVHVLVAADAPPERVMTQLKAHASRALTDAGLLAVGERAWARHGSTRHVFGASGLEAAWRYVREHQ